jgi:hypothetical protein
MGNTVTIANATGAGGLINQMATNQSPTPTLPTNPTVVCDATFNADTNEPADQILGFTYFAFDSTGKEVGALIAMNAQAGAQGNIGTLSATVSSVGVAHEMGHSLGLGHSADQSALMYFDVSGKNSLALAQDDMAGITFLYPRSEPGTGGFLGCASVAVVGGGGSGKGGSPGSGDDAAIAEFAALLAACAAAAVAAKKPFPRPI